MGQLLDVDDLVTAGIVVVRMGLTRIQRVHQLMRAQPPMPEPVYVGPRILLWHWPGVVDWATATNRAALSPEDWVPRSLIGERLDLDVDDLEGLPVSASRKQEGEVLWRWRDAEALWIERTNRPGG